MRCWNSRLTLELLTLSTFENYGNWVKVCEVSELPMHARTPDRRNSRPSRHLKTSRWPLPVHTGHVTRTVNLQVSLKRETSQLPTIARTPDRRNFRLMSELPTNQPENNKNFIMAGHIPDTSVINSQISKIQVSSFVSQTLKTHMGWLEHLWNIIYQHDASLLIVWHSY